MKLRISSGAFSLFIMFFVASCGGGKTDTPLTGSEGGPCYSNGTCDAGLVCNSSEICEKPAADPCEGVSCSDHGACVVVEDAATCTCDSGYHVQGLNCVEDIDPCNDVTCSGHGTCEVVSGDATCNCDAGYHVQGLNCVEDIDPCNDVTCSGHGTCEVVSGDATCNCDAGYHAQGLNCVEDVDPCDGVTCSGHGTCEVVSGDATCNCDSGYHAQGLNCVEDVDPCDGVTCSGHGTCEVISGDATCNCNSGYHAENLECLEDIQCTPMIDANFSSSMAPFGNTNGNVSVVNGRLRMERTGSNEADAFADFSSSIGDDVVVSFDAELLTSASRVALALRGTAPEKNGYYVVLQNETQNGSVAGLFLFYNSRTGNHPGSETPYADILIEHPFTPPVGTEYSIRLTRDANGQFELFLDAASVGTASDSRVTSFASVSLNAGQDTSSGHGGFFDNIFICGQASPTGIVFTGRIIRALAYDSGILWVTHYAPGNSNYCKIAKVDVSSGSVLEESAEQPWNGRGITVGNGSLWLVDAWHDVVHKIDPSTLTDTGTFNTPGSEPSGIAFDGTDLWLVDPWYQKVYKLSTSGSVLGNFSIPNEYRHGIEWEGNGMWMDTGDMVLSHYTSDGTIDNTATITGIPAGSMILDIALGNGLIFVAANSDTVYVQGW